MLLLLLLLLAVAVGRCCWPLLLAVAAGRCCWPLLLLLLPLLLLLELSEAGLSRVERLLRRSPPGTSPTRCLRVVGRGPASILRSGVDEARSDSEAADPPRRQGCRWVSTAQRKTDIGKGVFSSKSKGFGSRAACLRQSCLCRTPRATRKKSMRPEKEQLGPEAQQHARTHVIEKMFQGQTIRVRMHTHGYLRMQRHVA